MATSIKGLERRLMTVGKIRCGDQIATAKGKKRPHVLDRFRLTSSNAFLLNEAEKLYGGKTQVWEGAPAGSKQYELYVEVDAIPIIIPPMDSLSQCYEMWAGGGCVRRCDGEFISYALDRANMGLSCQCPHDPEERQALASDGQACKLTTRISCMLPDLPGISLWSLETHSYYASLWTAGMAEMLETMAKQGRICEALLRIERQSRKGKNGVRHFSIPVIHAQQMTPRQLFAQEIYQSLNPTPQRLLDAPAEQAKTLQDHISDLYGPPPPPAMDPDIADLAAQLEAVVAAHGGDVEALYTWAEGKLHKPRAQFTTDDLTGLLATVRERAKTKTAQKAPDSPVDETSPSDMSGATPAAESHLDDTRDAWQREEDAERETQADDDGQLTL